MPNTMTLIEAHDLGLAYERLPVLSRISLAIKKGEIVTVVGPNGSGKSTLVKALLGALSRTTGSITRKPGLRIGYVPQKLVVDASMPLTVKRFLSLPKSKSTSEITEALSKTGASGLENRQTATLSGGQFQRVLLARALLSDPELLVLDEPTQGLDQPGIAEFYQMIDALRHELSCAVVLVSHDLHVVMSTSDRVICLNGHICCQGTPHVVQAMPEYRALFGLGTKGALALYQHAHDHNHDHSAHDGEHNH